MNKINVKKLLLSLLLGIAVLVIFTPKSDATNKINKITMDVYVDNNGTAKITEIWETSLTEGTEGYKPYGNLGKCKISNFSVTDSTRKQYTTLSKWKTKDSFEEKAYKCGINKTNSGVELCWGISQYGNRTYTLKYEISNFVNQYKDSQGIYFSLIPKEMTQTPQSVIITIRSDKKFTKENSQIWAFGYPKGDIQFVNGNIVMDSKGSLPSSNYMVALIKLENGTFNATNKVNKTFDQIYTEAQKGVSSANTKIFTVLYIICGLIASIGVGFLIYGCIGAVKNRNQIKSSNLNFEKGALKLPKTKDIPYNRYIPFEGNLLKAFWINYYYNIGKYSNSCKALLLGAFLLKWVKEGRATICKTNKGIFNVKDNEYAIDLSKMEPTENKLENELISILLEACGDNELLEPHEFDNWCYHNFEYVNRWFRKVLSNITAELEKEGLVTTTCSERKIEKIVNVEIRNLAIELYGLKRYLLDYSLIHQREAKEVALWEDYLVYAQLLGIANEVQKQFKELYPNFNEISNINIDYSTTIATNFFYEGLKSARSGENNSKYNSSSSSSSGGYSSGSGGSSFSGGGSSSSGHSSGGGFR